MKAVSFYSTKDRGFKYASDWTIVNQGPVIVFL